MTPTAATTSFQCAVVFAPKQSLSLPTLSPFPTTAHKPFSLFTQTLQLSATHLTLKALISISRSESKKNVKCGCAVSSELSNDGGFIVVNFYRFVFIQDPELEVSKHLSFLQVFTEQMIFFCWPYLVQKRFGWDNMWGFGILVCFLKKCRFDGFVRTPIFWNCAKTNFQEMFLKSSCWKCDRRHLSLVIYLCNGICWTYNPFSWCSIFEIRCIFLEKQNPYLYIKICGCIFLQSKGQSW